jgi:hypothetical protein
VVEQRYVVGTPDNSACLRLQQPLFPTGKTGSQSPSR